MEVILKGSEGLPEGAVLSIKFGETKRQAPVSKIGQQFRFSNSPVEPLPLKVEILTPAAPPQTVALDPAREDFEVSFGGGAKVFLSQRAVSELQRPVVDIKTAAGEKGLPAEKLHLAQKAASYLEEHDLVRTFQDILHGLLVAKPKDPHAYVEERLARAKKAAAAKNGTNDARRSSEESPHSRRESNDLGNKRSTVRQNLRQEQEPQNRRTSTGSNKKKVDTLMMTLRAASDNLPLVMPFIPAELRTELESPHFRAECERNFMELDKEDHGELTPDELTDVIVYLTRAKSDAITPAQCRKFSDMFDADKDGLISMAEFTQLVQFVTVAGFLESEDGQKLISEAMVSENSFQDFIGMIEGDKERLWSIIPFLPERLVEHVTGAEFQDACMKHFDDLDSDKSESLEPRELIPVIQSISEASTASVTISEEKCIKFTSLFDTDGNGSISRDEFVEFAQFLTVMNFLTNTAEGTQITELAEVSNSAERTARFINMLTVDPMTLGDVLKQSPKALVRELLGPLFAEACSNAFMAAGGSDSEPVAPGQLVSAIQQLAQVHPFRLTEDQCTFFISQYDKEQKNSVTHSEFLFLARYVILLGFLTYQRDNQDMLMADVMLGADKVQSLLAQLKQGEQNVWELVPFLPEEFVEMLSSEDFENQCNADFSSLDADGSGVLEPKELMPIIISLSEAHSLSLTEDHCTRFVDIFDVHNNGVIDRGEFIQFVQFMMIMSFMETPEGWAAQRDAEVAKSNRSVEELLAKMEKDRDSVHKVMPLLPKDVYEHLISDAFVKDCTETFEGLDEDKSGTLQPEELFPMVIALSEAHPYGVTMDQCARFTAIFNIRGDGVLRQDEYLDFARFICIMSYLNSAEGKAAAADAIKVMDDSKRIEDLIKTMSEDKEAISQVIPYLPSSLRNELQSDRFTYECLRFFEDLDKDTSGVLEPNELFPMILGMADAHQMSLDLDQCKRFTSIFDEDKDKLISIGEFVQFSRFMIIMAFLQSQEGEAALLIALDQGTEESRCPPRPGSQEVLPSPPSLMDDSFAALVIQDGPCSPAHLAIDVDFYRDKSEKLTLENDHMRGRMNSLEDLVRQMQRKMEEQDIRLRHAEVDLGRSGNLRM